MKEHLILQLFCKIYNQHNDNLHILTFFAKNKLAINSQHTNYYKKKNRNIAFAGQVEVSN